MVKSCCAVGCTNRLSKGSNIPFYHFPANPQRRFLWIAVINRKYWQPQKHTWLCSSHFISRKNSDDHLSPDYVPCVFDYVDNPVKRKRLDACIRRKGARTARLETTARSEAAVSLLLLNDIPEPELEPAPEVEPGPNSYPGPGLH